MRHPQVETDFGFTCDIEVLPVIKAIWSIGFKTVGSCQHWNEDKNPLYIERYIGIIHDDLHKLLNLAIYINNDKKSVQYSSSKNDISRMGFAVAILVI